MKKKSLFLSIAMAALTLAGCGTQGLFGGMTGGDQSASTLGNVLGSVLGAMTRPTQQQLIRTWNYSQPGCAFTSDKLLAQAGGEVVASQIKNKLQPSYEQVGVKQGNTSITFNNDGTFAAKIAGKSLSGTFTYDESTQKVTLKGLLMNVNCYAKRNSDGIALLFESSKLLSLLQTMSALSGNTSLQTVGELSKNYDGLRLGFDFR